MISLSTKAIRSNISVLQSIRKFQNSKAQSHLHNYIRDESQLKEIKKSIDYQTIQKNSEGRFYFREFQFQQPIAQTLIPIQSFQKAPFNRWLQNTSIDDSNNQSIYQLTNQTFIQQANEHLNLAFKRYYEKMGKHNYKFILREEIGRVQYMTASEFYEFLKKLSDKPLSKQHEKLFRAFGKAHTQKTEMQEKSTKAAKLAKQMSQPSQPNQ